VAWAWSARSEATSQLPPLPSTVAAASEPGMCWASRQAWSSVAEAASTETSVSAGGGAAPGRVETTSLTSAEPDRG